MREGFTKYSIPCDIPAPFFRKQVFGSLSVFGGGFGMHKNWFSARLNARKGMPLVLATCWISGLLFGAFPYFFFSPETFPLMHRTISCSASIVGLLNAALLPFLLSAFFGAFSMPLAIAGVCFVKAFLFSFVSLGILVSFGSGGWLLRYLFLFSDCVTLPVLFGYWFGFVSAPIKSRLVLTTCVVLLALAVVTILDYHVIAPIVCVIDSMKG